MTTSQIITFGRWGWGQLLLAHFPCETAATPQQDRSLPLPYQLLQQKYAVSNASSNTRRIGIPLFSDSHTEWGTFICYKALYSRFCTGFSSAYLVPYAETAKPSLTTLPGYTTSSVLSAFIAYPGSSLFSLAPALLLSPGSLCGLG